METPEAFLDPFTYLGLAIMAVVWLGQRLESNNHRLAVALVAGPCSGAFAFVAWTPHLTIANRILGFVIVSLAVTIFLFIAFGLRVRRP